MDKMTLDEALEQFNQIKDHVRAKQLISTALEYAMDYIISWDEFEAIAKGIKIWALTRG